MSFIAVGRNSQSGPAALAAAPSTLYSRAGSMNVESFVPWGCPVVANTAIRTAAIADIAIRFWDRRARDQKKLFPHFGEAGTAVFAVKEIEDGGHDRPPSSDHRQAIIPLRRHT